MTTKNSEISGDIDCLHYAYCNDCGKKLNGNHSDINDAWDIANEHSRVRQHDTTVKSTCDD